MAKRKDYLVRSLVASLALHAALLSLQFGAPGMGLPWPSLAWNERKASVPTIQAVLRGQTPIAIPQQKTADMAEAPLPRVPAKAEVTEVNKPPPAPLPASLPDQPGTMTASIAAAKVATPPPAIPNEVATPVVKAKEKRSQIAGSAVLSTDKEAQWSIRAARTAQESADESRDDRSVMEAAREAEAIEKKMNDELAEQRRLAKAAEENRERQRAEVLARTAALKAAEEARERLDALALARSAEEKRAEEQAAMINAQEAALEKNRAEALPRAMEAKRKEAQIALTKAEEEAQQRAEALARAAALKAAEEAQERKRIEALAAARLAEEKKVEEQAAMIREKEAALEKKRLEALQRAAEEKRKEEQAALAKAKEEELERKRAEALARTAEEKRKEEQAALAKAKEEAQVRAAQATLATQAAQAEARAREQAASAVNQANAQRSPAQITPASDRGAGSSTSAMTGKQGAGKPGSSGQKGGDLASRALDMARSGLSGLPVKVPFDTGQSRRGSILGRNPSDIQLTFYGESWMQKVERIASLNYPQLSKNRSYGSLVITVSINSDGTLAAVRVVKTSGSAELDAAARHIVEMSAPFSAFPPDLKRNYDAVDITRTLSFPEKPPLIFGQ